VIRRYWSADTVTPYVYLKVNPATGVYKLHAVATDNSGAATASAVVSVTVLGTRETLKISIFKPLLRAG